MKRWYAKYMRNLYKEAIRDIDIELSYCFNPKERYLLNLEKEVLQAVLR